MPEEIALSRGKAPTVVHIPHQTSVGFEAVVPTDADAKDLGKFIERSRLGRGRTRVQPVYAVKAVELKWAPVTGTMPPFRDFADVVAQWARRKGYAMARDLRELRTGLETLRGGRTAHRVMRRYAAVSDKGVETVLESAYFHINNGGLSISLVETATYSDGSDLVPSRVYREYACRYTFTSHGGKVVGQFDLGSQAMVKWLVGALSRVLAHIARSESEQSYSPYERSPSVSVVNSNPVEERALVASVAARYAASSTDGLLTTLARGRKLVADVGSWASKFPQVLRSAERTAAPTGWVWQDEFVPFFAEYDEFISRFQDLDYALEGHWLKQTGKVKDAVARARRIAREPGGKAAVTYPTNDFEFLPHPEKGEHIAYKVSDLKTWHRAVSDWVDDGDRVLQDLMKELRRK